jgi:hypothetical protein
LSQQLDFAVLVYGDSYYLELVERKLKYLPEFRVIHVDAALPDAKNGLTNLKAQIMIYDQKIASEDAVTVFWLKNPFAPVVGLQPDKDRELVVICREYSRLETSGLPQVLKVLADEDALN